MTYAFSLIPASRPGPDGKPVKVDKSDPNKFLIPDEDARRIIRAATRSAYAEACELPDLARANYQALMKSEEAKKVWSDQQLLMINALHMFSASYFTGNVKITTEGAGRRRAGACRRRRDGLQGRTLRACASADQACRDRDHRAEEAGMPAGAEAKGHQRDQRLCSGGQGARQPPGLTGGSPAVCPAAPIDTFRHSRVTERGRSLDPSRLEDRRRRPRRSAAITSKGFVAAGAGR